ncbi:MAG TPA: hypothetical protein VEL51_24995 [Vicinamibacterales bacterium]|nr:hypothetical protein [Vicinamibacterales bacterium]
MSTNAANQQSTVEPCFEERLADIVVTAIKMAIAPLRDRIAALEGRASQTDADPTIDRAAIVARLKALEDRPALTYAGVFEHGVAYREGALVTRSGSLWLALHDTRATPGSDPEKWRLVVKSGQAV